MSKRNGNVIVVVFIKHVGFCKENGGARIEETEEDRVINGLLRHSR